MAAREAAIHPGFDWALWSHPYDAELSGPKPAIPALRMMAFAMEESLMILGRSSSPPRVQSGAICKAAHHGGVVSLNLV
ncbi:MAG TPA: hypothetical protein VE957_12405 [Terriglobales bacterium]|nr:hypothetical protein [Terriglobales bacterium]